MPKAGRKKMDYWLSLIVCWTLLIGTIMAVTLVVHHRAVIRVAENKARDYFRLNLYYRIWASNFGGVYVPIDKAAPNPYLTVPDREITTSTGRTFTLINPAYMTSMVFREIGKASPDPIISRIVSNKPINPENGPDEWERMALGAFERREMTELSQVIDIEGKPYLRFISRFIAEKPCLQCHNGYVEGTVRGGLSISVPLEASYAAAKGTRGAIVAGYLLLWGMGSAGILLTTKKRKQYERKLEASEQKLRTVCDWNHDWEYWSSPSGAMLYVSPSAEQVTGYPAEAFVADPRLVGRVVHQEDAGAFDSHVNACHSTHGGSRETEFRIIRADGETRWIHHACRAVVEDGVFEGMRVSNRDITRRKAAEEALRISENFTTTLNRISRAFLSNGDEETIFDEVLRVILETMRSPYGVVGYVDESGCYVCPSMTKSVWTECQMSRKTTIFPPHTWEGTIWGECLLSGVPRYRNVTFPVPPGHVPITRCLAVPLVDQQRVVGLILVANCPEDYTDRDMEFLCRIGEHITPIVSARLQQQQAARALRESHERYARLYSAMSQGMAMFEVIPDEAGEPADYRYVEVNPAYERMVRLTREELIGHTIRELFPDLDPASFEAVAKVATTGAESVEYTFSLNDRDYQFFAYSPHAGHVAVLVYDITEVKRQEEERRLFEQQMMHAQKLESLGVLAGGIAHDFNNILTSVIGNAELALLRVGDDSPAADNLIKIEQASLRATELARQMLAYSGKGRFMIQPLDLNRLIREMVFLLEVAISKKVVIKYSLAEHLPALEGDATQLRQVIMNIVINASEAIGDKSGVVAVRTGCVECDSKYLQGVWLEENLAPGMYLSLEIADTGCGMPKEVLDKMFDPFYTTKFTGRGLGMAAVLGIIRGHNGAIKVYSEPGRGTTFKLLFPASQRPPALFDGGGNVSAWKGEGTVLLVDDEETICAIGSEMLRELGFAVVTAADGNEALARYRERNDFRCVILDLTMPHKDGEQTFRELRILNPEVKVIMSSGYNELEINDKFAGKGLSGFIQKPYKMSELQEVLRRVLAGC